MPDVKFLSPAEQGELIFREWFARAVGGFSGEAEDGHALAFAGQRAAENHDRLAALRRKADSCPTAPKTKAA